MTSHKEAYEEYNPTSAKKEKKRRGLSGSDKSENATPAKKNRQESSQVSAGASAIMSRRGQSTPPMLADIATAVSVSSSITDSFSHYDLPHIQCRSFLCQAGTAHLVEQFKVLCHDFITFNNIPVRAATSHHDCPEFKNLIMFALNHGAQIKKQVVTFNIKHSHLFGNCYCFQEHSCYQNTLCKICGKQIGDRR
jgi:hypothetical protein